MDKKALFLFFLFFFFVALDLLYLYNQMCMHSYTRYRWPLTGECQAVCCHESKPAETIRVAKLVGSFSVRMKPISVSPGFICTAVCSPLLLFLSLEKRSRRMCRLRFSVREGQASNTKANKMTGG